MDNDMSSKERSSLYPSYSINECLDVVFIINKIGGKLVSTSRIAEELKVSITTNSFRAKLSTCRQFNLIKIAGASTLQLTDLSKRVLFPTSDMSKCEAIRQAFMSAPLYQKLCQRFENQALPNKERLGNILLQEYGITKAAKDVAAEQFINSAEQIGILKNGVLIFEDEPTHNNTIESSDGDQQESEPIDTKLNSRNELNHTPVLAGYRFEIPTLSGTFAQFIIPLDVSVKDLDFIEKYIQTMLPIFMTNLREEKSGQ